VDKGARGDPLLLPSKNKLKGKELQRGRGRKVGWVHGEKTG